MFPLLHLPVTLVEDIVKLLCPHCYLAGPDSLWNKTEAKERRAALYALSLTNRFLNSAATPLLYHQPAVGVFASEKTLSSFARTICQLRPELAKHVKSIRIDQSPPLDNLSDEGEAVFEAVMDTLGSALDVDNEQGTTKDLLSILLSVCTEVEEVRTQAGFYDEFEAGLVIFDRPGSLPKLRRAFFSHWDTEGGFNLEELINFFAAASNLRSLTAVQVIEVGGEVQPLALGNLRVLDLHESAVDSESLNRLLRFSPKLERFLYRAGDSSVSYEDPILPRQLADTLIAHVPKLKHLTIELGPGFEFGWPASTDALISSLEELSCLETLYIDADSLLLLDESRTTVEEEPDDGMFAKLLPNSIRRFTLELGPAPETRAQALLRPLLSLAVVCNDQFPALERVTVFEIDRDGTAGVESAFAKAGVEFRDDVNVESLIDDEDNEDEDKWPTRAIGTIYD